MAGHLHSFAILAFGDSPFLEECITSLKNQHEPSQLFLATSTPSPYLDAIADKYTIPVFRNPGGGTIAADWTFAYAIATTKYVTLAHQDDVFHPRYTEACIDAMESSGKALIAFTDYCESFGGMLRCMNLNLLIKRMILAPFFFLKNNLSNIFLKRALLMLGSPIPCPSVMYNRETIGQFAFDETFTVNLDWDAWIRLSERTGDFICIRERLLTHRIHSDSQTSASIANKRRRLEDELLFKRLWPGPIAAFLAKCYQLSYQSNS